MTAERTIENTTKTFTTAHPLKINEACPGVDYLLQQNKTDITILKVNVSRLGDVPMCGFHEGVVYGTFGDSETFCRMSVYVSPGMYVQAHVRRLAYWCESGFWSFHTEPNPSWLGYVRCDGHTLPDMFYETDSNYMCFKSRNSAQVQVGFQAINDHDFIVKYKQKYAGYLTVPIVSSANLGFSKTISVPKYGAVITSISQSYTHRVCGHSNSKWLWFYPDRYLSSEHRIRYIETCPYLTAPVLSFKRTLVITVRYSVLDHSGLRIYFSIIFWRYPLYLPNGLFNCSVDYYSQFRDHVHCNQNPECEDRRDETEHCPFSSPGCQGLVASGNKCFKLVISADAVHASLAAVECRSVGGLLGNLETLKKKRDSLSIFQNYLVFYVATGYTSGWKSVPFMYSKFRKWSDNTLIYNMIHLTLIPWYYPSRTIKGVAFTSMHFQNEKSIDLLTYFAALCEIRPQEIKVFPPRVVLPQSLFLQLVYTNTKQFLSECPGNHVAHVFLLYDFNSRRKKATSAHACVLLQVNNTKRDEMIVSGETGCAHTLFKCDDGVTAVHYTFVCDFRRDCPDNSDELFCEHPSCPGFQCSNRQCVLHSQRCNEHSDCVDHSDEGFSGVSDYILAKEGDIKQRLYVNLDGTGYFTQHVMSADEPCPDSHYRCTSEWLYCHPVYTLCNGFADCVHGEDEQDCERMTCPGFYRCRASRVCVHGDHLCDGWGQCPQQDDELMCDITCPEGCLCQGHSFLCNRPFSVDLFPHLRYMDASGSEMTLADFKTNIYLIHLSLLHCSLVNISSLTFANVQVIDVTNNHLTSLDIGLFHELPNLKILQLSNNPLTEFTSKVRKHIHYSLSQVEVWETSLTVLDKVLQVYLPHLTCLNLSFSAIERIGVPGFRNMPQLADLDIKGNPLKHFALDLLTRSIYLKEISSSNYRLCCDNLLPKESAEINCLAPHTVFPSCTNLLPSELHRTIFWIVSVFAIWGNLFCSTTLHVVRKIFGKNFIMSFAHLHCANICMGIHAGIAVIADKIYRGKYIHFEKTWTTSVMCKMSGFLSFLSTEVSVVIIWFITLHHVLVLCFSLDSQRFRTIPTAKVCSLSWIVGILLSMIPFLPGLSTWGLYDQSGLCRLALFDMHSSFPKFRWFTVTVVINSMLCLMTVAGHIFISVRTPMYIIALDPSKRSVYSSVHLMGKVAVTAAVCWLSFGLVTLMTSVGVTVLDRVYDAMVVFVLPLSSALNPLFYMWTAVTEQRQQTQELKLLTLLKTQYQQKKSA